MKLTFQKSDVVAVVLVVLLAAAVAAGFQMQLQETENKVLSIYQNGELIREVSLEQNNEITIKGTYTNIIVIYNGAAAIASSDCPGEDCVHSGSIQEAGRSIVCLPNRVELRISGAGTEVDFIVR